MKAAPGNLLNSVTSGIKAKLAAEQAKLRAEIDDLRRQTEELDQK